MRRREGGRQHREMYSGQMYERDMFGEFKMSKEGRQAFKEAATRDGYMRRGQAMDFIREHGMEDPTNPTRPFANELRLAVAEELGLESNDEMDLLRYYSAVGTPLDVFHGIDGWIEFNNGRIPRSVTMDVTRNKLKDEHKADLIVHEVPDPSEDEEKFMKAVYEQYGPAIAKKLMPAVRVWRRQQERRAQIQQERGKK